MKLDVVLSPPEIDLLPQRDLSQTTAVVFDVLRATSTMITALAQGVAEIFPARSIEEARTLKERWPDAQLGGERHGDKIEGFAFGNSPLEYRHCPGARIITTTTNGTIALRACEDAQAVLVGALLNIDALAVFLNKNPPAEVLLVCAGTGRELALEDVIAAGMLCARFPEAERTDAARVACAIFSEHRDDLLSALSSAHNGRALLAKNRAEELRWCAQTSLYDLLGQLTAGVIRAVRLS